MLEINSACGRRECKSQVESFVYVTLDFWPGILTKLLLNLSLQSQASDRRAEGHGFNRQQQ